ncbi:LOW QUALITY PROTEIN: hypothetical protein ACHAWC_005167 [Mediolabrus comicus]
MVERQLVNQRTITCGNASREQISKACLLGLAEMLPSLVTFTVNTSNGEEVSKNPRHTLIEIDMEDPTAGEQLEAYLGVNRTCWGQGNANKRNNDAIPLHELGR